MFLAKIKWRKTTSYKLLLMFILFKPAHDYNVIIHTVYNEHLIIFIVN